MPKKLKPCKGCGGPKPRVPGVQYCDTCSPNCSEHGRTTVETRRHCKECRAAYARDFREKNPEFKALNLRRIRAKSYGITLDELALYEAVTECEVCGNGGDMVIDHNHTTGEIRGVICRGCNTALGMAQDSSDVLRKLADYLDERGSY